MKKNIKCNNGNANRVGGGGGGGGMWVCDDFIYIYWKSKNVLIFKS